MAGSPKKRERKARTEALLKDEMAIGTLCGRVASGETLIEICRDLDIPYSEVNTWIQSNKSRAESYAQALTVRESHNKDRVVSELLAMINADITQAFLPDGSLKAMDKIPENVRRWIAGFELHEQYDQEGNVVGALKKVKLWDKVRVTELLAKHLKMLVDRQQVEVGDSLIDLLSDLNRTQSKGATA
jgi:hypothetical protein